MVVVEFLDRAVPEDLIKPTQFNRHAVIFTGLLRRQAFLAALALRQPGPRYEGVAHVFHWAA